MKRVHYEANFKVDSRYDDGKVLSATFNVACGIDSIGRATSFTGRKFARSGQSDLTRLTRVFHEVTCSRCKSFIKRNPTGHSK